MDAFAQKIESVTVSAQEPGPLHLHHVIQRHDAERADTVDDQLEEKEEIFDSSNELSPFVLPPVQPLNPLPRSLPLNSSFLPDGRSGQQYMAQLTEAADRKQKEERFEAQDEYSPFQELKSLWAAASGVPRKRVEVNFESQLIQWAANQDLNASKFLFLLNGYLKRSV